MITDVADARSLAIELVQGARTGAVDDAVVRRLADIEPVDLAAALADPADRLAFWINVYNGAVRASILRDPDSYARRWRFFTAPAITVAGRRLSANAIEHGILRRSAFLVGLGYGHNPIPSSFERRLRVERVDPRVHFALNCGARSCPPLHVYAAGTLDAELDAAARSYIAGESALLDGGATVRVPRLLLWYLGDFGGRPGIVRLLRRYGVIEPDATPRVTFGSYDWTLAVD